MERGCVQMHQPQHDEKVSGIRRIPAGRFCEAAAAGLQHSRAPGQCADAPINHSVVKTDSTSEP
jgi:hypothetical protein